MTRSEKDKRLIRRVIKVRKILNKMGDTFSQDKVRFEHDLQHLRLMEQASLQHLRLMEQASSQYLQLMEQAIWNNHYQVALSGINTVKTGPEGSIEVIEYDPNFRPPEIIEKTYQVNEMPLKKGK